MEQPDTLHDPSAVISDKVKTPYPRAIDASAAFGTRRGRGQAFVVLARVLLFLFAMRDLSVP